MKFYVVVIDIGGIYEVSITLIGRCSSNLHVYKYPLNGASTAMINFSGSSGWYEMQVIVAGSHSLNSTISSGRFGGAFSSSSSFGI
jgi:hypothetical protein